MSDQGDWSDWIWVEKKDHYMRPLNGVIDILVAWSVRKKGWMVKVYNRLTYRLDPYKAGPFSTREEAFGIGNYYITTRIQLLDYLLTQPPDQGQDAPDQ